MSVVVLLIIPWRKRDVDVDVGYVFADWYPVTARGISVLEDSILLKSQKKVPTDFHDDFQVGGSLWPTLTMVLFIVVTTVRLF